MFYHLVNSEESLYIAVNAFKQEMECMNKAKDVQEMQTLQQIVVDDANRIDETIARYFKVLRDSYFETKSMHSNLQNI